VIVVVVVGGKIFSEEPLVSANVYVSPRVKSGVVKLKGWLSPPVSVEDVPLVDPNVSFRTEGAKSAITTPFVSVTEKVAWIEALAVSPKAPVETATSNRSRYDRTTSSPVPTTTNPIVALLFALEVPNEMASPDPSATLLTATPPVVASPAEIAELARVPTNEPAPSAENWAEGMAEVPEKAWLTASAVPGVVDPFENVWGAAEPNALVSEIVSEKAVGLIRPGVVPVSVVKVRPVIWFDAYA